MFRREAVTKQEAAARQLRAAVRLFFDGGDTLAVHTLTGAAFQLLADLGKVRGVASPFRSEQYIRPDRVQELNRALNGIQNFLKHADRDPSETLDYADESTVLYLFETVELAYLVLESPAREMLAYRLWFVFSHPDLVNPVMLAGLQAANTVGLDQTDKRLWAEWLALPPR